MSKSVVILCDEDRSELSQVISDILGAEATSAFIDAIIENEPALILDGVKWGFSDTLVRETVASRCSKFLINRSWPTYGDKLSREQFSKFEEDLKKSYAEWNANLSQSL